MQIHVKTPAGKKITMDVDPSDTIKDVKKKVADKAGIPVDEQRLLFEDKELPDHPTLSDSNIKHGDTLDLGGMQIDVKHWNGDTFTLDVNPNDTINDVKSGILKRKKIPRDQQRLTFGGRPLKDDRATLKDSKIKHKSILELQPMQIHVKTPAGKKITMDVDPSDTIKDVKKKVADKAGIPVDEQRLLFEDKELADHPTLSDSNIKHGDTLDLFLLEKVKPILPGRNVPANPKKSYLPEKRKEGPDRFGQVTVTTYKTDYAGDNDDSFLLGKVSEDRTSFKMNTK
jgi:ubiquitin